MIILKYNSTAYHGRYSSSVMTLDCPVVEYPLGYIGIIGYVTISKLHS